MKTAECFPVTPEPLADATGASSPSKDTGDSLGRHLPVSAKIQPAHLGKLATVYIRQSSPHQVLHNRESRERQYALGQRAVALGWPRGSVRVVDDDQGHSGRTAEDRHGFHDLLSEVTMGHVGLVLALEISRLARSNKDWHNLLELCAIFGTLLADEDGIYDPNDSNDRLLLGLKGTISEFELITMRNRLLRGRLNKAQRGELFLQVPRGYVIGPDGQVTLDPDEQAQSVVRLIFAKFEEIGSLYGVFRYLIQNNIRLPLRGAGGSHKGELHWRRASIISLWQMLHHPSYAGAYVYGRRFRDLRRTTKTSSRPYIRWRDRDEWNVLIKDRLPAYISWAQYEQNREQLKQNRWRAPSRGTPRQGLALLPGLVVCGVCGWRLRVRYSDKDHVTYFCHRHCMQAMPKCGPGFRGRPLDELVAQQVLKALEPASVELSLKAQADLEQERQRRHRHWQQNLQRAHYDCELAERRYKSVDPAYRLVAMTLEQNWETALRQERQLQEEYDRFQRERPRQLSPEERHRILEGASDIAGLWRMSSTTPQDRQAVLRCLVDRVVVHVRADSEHVDVTIHWAGGYTSQHDLVRTVQSYARLRDIDALAKRVAVLCQQGSIAREIAKRLNAEGFRPPQGRGGFTTSIVRSFLKRQGLKIKDGSDAERLAKDEWKLADLARQLHTTIGRLTDWARRGWVHSRRTPVRRYWILWADAAEVARLKKLKARSRRGVNQYPAALTTPKQRPLK
jgi:DNA invertase Pin-like site-specific DNA recombinase